MSPRDLATIAVCSLLLAGAPLGVRYLASRLRAIGGVPNRPVCLRAVVRRACAVAPTRAAVPWRWLCRLRRIDSGRLGGRVTLRRIMKRLRSLWPVSLPAAPGGAW